MGGFSNVTGFEPSPSGNGLGTTAVNMAADRCKGKNRKVSGENGKGNRLFHIENSIQTLQDRFVWYHEIRDAAQSGLFLYSDGRFASSSELPSAISIGLTEMKQKIPLKYIDGGKK